MTAATSIDSGIDTSPALLWPHVNTKGAARLREAACGKVADTGTRHGRPSEQRDRGVPAGRRLERGPGDLLQASAGRRLWRNAASAANSMATGGCPSIEFCDLLMRPAPPSVQSGGRGTL